MMAKQKIQAVKQGNYITVTAHLEVSVEKAEDLEGVFVACCPALDVSSQGNSKEHAIEMLKEAVMLFLDSIFEMNTIDEVLEELGFRKTTRPISTPSHDSAPYTESIEVPMSLIIAQGMNLVGKTPAC